MKCWTRQTKTRVVTHLRAKVAGGMRRVNVRHSRKESLIAQTNGSFARRARRPCFWTTDFLFRPDSSKSPAISLKRCQQQLLPVTTNAQLKFTASVSSSSPRRPDVTAAGLNGPRRSSPFDPFLILVTHANLAAAD